MMYIYIFKAQLTGHHVSCTMHQSVGGGSVKVGYTNYKRSESGVSSSGAFLPTENEEIHPEEIQYRILKHHFTKRKRQTHLVNHATGIGSEPEVQWRKKYNRWDPR